MIDKVREIIKQEASDFDWRFHVVPVVKYSKELAQKLGADEELAELAALLHDIGRFRFEAKDHEITGVPEAEKILKDLGYASDVIDEVKHCVESHRGSKDVKPETMIAEIVKNADAMAHFDIVPVFFYMNFKGSSFDDLLIWMEGKIERGWKKITIPEAREMMEEKHKAIGVVLDSCKEYV